MAPLWTIGSTNLKTINVKNSHDIDFLKKGRTVIDEGEKM